MILLAGVEVKQSAEQAKYLDGSQNWLRSRCRDPVKPLLLEWVLLET